MVRALIIMMLFAACTSGRDDGEDKGDQEGDGGLTIERPRQVSGRDGEAVSEQEGDLSQRPAEIAGAFLTCAMSSQKSGGDGDTYGCRLEREGDRVVLMNPALSKWSIVSDTAEGTFDETSSDALNLQAPGSLWHVIFALPRATALERKLRVEIDLEGQAQPVRFESSLKDATRRKFITFDKATIRLGSPGLVKSILTSCPIAIATTPVTGASLTYPFAIHDSNADVAVSVTGLCGVDTENNTVDLVRTSDRKRIASKRLRPGESSLHLSVPELSPGSYVIEIRSGQGPFGLDDFILRGIGIVVQNVRGRVSAVDP